jgi:hypothetical protein
MLLLQTVNNSGNVRTDIYGTFNGINTVGLKVGSNYVTVPGNFSIGDGAITFPTSDGTNGQVLTTDGSLMDLEPYHFKLHQAAVAAQAQVKL